MDISSPGEFYLPYVFASVFQTPIEHGVSSYSFNISTSPRRGKERKIHTCRCSLIPGSSLRTVYQLNSLSIILPQEAELNHTRQNSAHHYQDKHPHAHCWHTPPFQNCMPHALAFLVYNTRLRVSMTSLCQAYTLGRDKRHRADLGLIRRKESDSDEAEEKSRTPTYQGHLRPHSIRQHMCSSELLVEELRRK